VALGIALPARKLYKLYTRLPSDVRALEGGKSSVVVEMTLTVLPFIVAADLESIDGRGMPQNAKNPAARCSALRIDIVVVSCPPSPFFAQDLV